jgi:hypothetical protein
MNFTLQTYRKIVKKATKKRKYFYGIFARGRDLDELTHNNTKIQRNGVLNWK